MLTPYFGYKALVSNKEWKGRFDEAWVHEDQNAVLAHVAASAFVGYAVTTLYCIAQGSVKLIVGGVLGTIGFAPKSAILSLAKLVFDLFALTLLSENAIVIYNHGFKMWFKAFKKEVILPKEETLPWPISAIKSSSKAGTQTARETELEKLCSELMRYGTYANQMMSRTPALKPIEVSALPNVPTHTPTLPSQTLTETLYGFGAYLIQSYFKT